MAVDLHLHTTHSDGSYAPKDLVDLVRRFNVDVMAVTDHDDISGVPEAQAHGREVDVRVIAGIELSIDYPLQGRAHLHLLGLMLDIDNPDLLATLHYLRDTRRSRAKEIIERLQKLNIDVQYEELEQVVSGESIGRPHIAQLLVKNGVVRQVSEAFEKYLGRNAPAFVPKKKMGLAEAIELVHKAKGLSILAHPISLFAKDFEELRRYLDHFRALGLDGVEAYYSYHSKELTRFLLDYAKENKMAVSGGSDFHGKAKPDIQPAIGTGNLHIPPKIVKELDQFYQLKYGGSKEQMK